MFQQWHEPTAFKKLLRQICGERVLVAGCCHSRPNMPWTGQDWEHWQWQNPAESPQRLFSAPPFKPSTKVFLKPALVLPAQRCRYSSSHTVLMRTHIQCAAIRDLQSSNFPSRPSSKNHGRKRVLFTFDTPSRVLAYKTCSVHVCWSKEWTNTFKIIKAICIHFLGLLK